MPSNVIGRGSSGSTYDVSIPQKAFRYHNTLSGISKPEIDDLNESESEDDDPDEEEDRESMKKPIFTGLSTTYVPLWTAAHGFREFYQNWADGIKETNALGATAFDTKLEDENTTWLFKALHPKTGKFLGFIRFIKNKGTVELTNFGAQLSPKTLDLGYSSKRTDENMAGVHGEGYKVASLVMLREGYRVKLTTLSRDWNFRFGGPQRRQLKCCFSNPSKNPITARKALEKVRNQMAAYNNKLAMNKPREPEANAWEDVTVLLGGGRGKYSAKKVSRDDFCEWILHCIDLDPPASGLSIKTKLGDLILDPRFRNKIYLKGLMLESASISHPWSYSYNFARGEVNRDRQQVASPKKQAKVIAGIWDEAFKKNKNATVLPYLEMLRADKPFLDVVHAEENISEAMAKEIWEQIRKEDPESKFFYYYCESGDKDIEFIQKCLKKEAKSLPRVIWMPLRNFKLIRTPEEQRCHLLQNAPVSDLPNTPYSQGFKRLLKAVLALDPRTKEVDLEFRSGAKAELDLLLEGSKLLVNDRWLDFYSSHAVNFCSLFEEATANNLSIDCFSCGHIMTDLYELLLIELSKFLPPKGIRDSGGNESLLRLKVKENVDQMPCKVGVVAAERAQELIVSWVHSESEKASKLHSLDLKGLVTLHRMSTCADKILAVLSLGSAEVDGLRSIEDSSLNVNCGCPEKIVSLTDSSIIFQDLDHNEQYFPMVSRTAPRSFFGIPPLAASPKPPQITYPAPIPAAAPSPASTNSTPHTNRPDRHNPSDLHVAPIFDDEDDYSVQPVDEGYAEDRSHQRSSPRPGNTSNTVPSSLRPRSSLPDIPATTLHSQENNNLQGGIENLQEKIDEKEIQVQNYENENEDLHEQLAFVNEELRVAKSRISHHEVQSLQQNLPAAKNPASRKKILDLQQQVETLRAQYHVIETELDKKNEWIRLEEDKSQAQEEILQFTKTKLREALAAIPQWTMQLEAATAQHDRMKERLKTLEKEVLIKEEALQTASSLNELIKKSDQDSRLMIDQLRSDIEQLQTANSRLEEDLEMSQDINSKQAQLAANRAARIRSLGAGVKREFKEENDNELLGPCAKRLRRLDAITNEVGGVTVLD